MDRAALGTAHHHGAGAHSGHRNAGFDGTFASNPATAASAEEEYSGRSNSAPDEAAAAGRRPSSRGRITHLPRSPALQGAP